MLLATHNSPVQDQLTKKRDTKKEDTKKDTVTKRERENKHRQSMQGRSGEEGMYREVGRKQSKQAKQRGLEGEAAAVSVTTGAREHRQTDNNSARVCFSLGQFGGIAKMAIIHRKI